LDLDFSAGGVTEVFVVGHDCKPISATVAGFSVGDVAACDYFFTVELMVAEVVHEGGGDIMSRFAVRAGCTCPVTLGYREEGGTFEVEPSFAVSGCGAFE
jgi:hypothetical protein